MKEVTSADYLGFLRKEEGFRGDVYEDSNGHRTIGYGHKLADDEEFTGGISKEDAETLLAKDVGAHFNRARSRVGPERFDQLSSHDKLKLLDVDYNAGLASFPNFIEAVVSGDTKAQVEESTRYHHPEGVKTELERSKRYKTMFFGELEDEELPTVKKVANQREQAIEQQEQEMTPLAAKLASRDFKELSPGDQFRDLAKFSPEFDRLMSESPDRAWAWLDKQTALHEASDPTMWDSLKTGFQDTGVGMLQQLGSNVAMIAEELGLENDFDDSWQKAADLNFLEAGHEMGSEWHDQLAGMVGALPGALAPIAAGTVAAAGTLPLLGVGAVGTAFAAPMIGAGLAAGLGSAHHGPEAAMKRAAVEGTLGALGPLTGHLSRFSRVGIETAAAYPFMEGDSFAEKGSAALALGVIAGTPGKRAPLAVWKKLSNADPSLKKTSGYAEAESKAQSYRSSIESQAIESTSPYGETKDLAYFQKVYADAIREDPPVNTFAQERTPGQTAKIQNRVEDSAADMRPVNTQTRGELEARKKASFRPGPKWTEKRVFSTNEGRVEALQGGKYITSGQVLEPMLRKFGLTINRMNKRDAKKANGTWTLNKTQRPRARAPRNRVELADPHDVQVAAHELGHALAYEDVALAKYNQTGAAMKADFARLDEIAIAHGVGPAKVGNDIEFTGITPDPNAPYKASVSGIFKLAEDGKIPEDLAHIPELLSVSYDRDNAAEGMAEAFRIWTTNNKDFGGEHKLEKMIPRTKKILEAWKKGENVDGTKIEGLSKSDVKARKATIQKFQEDAHQHLAMNGETAMATVFGPDANLSNTMASRAMSLRQSTVDDLSGLMYFDKELGVEGQGTYEAARLLRGAGDAGDGMIEFGHPRLTTDAKGRQMVKYEGNSLKKIFDPVSNSGKEFDDAMTYITARQAVPLYEKGLEKLLSKEMIESGLALGKKYPQFPKFHDDMREFADGVGDFLVDTGVLGKDQRENFVRKDSFIFSFFREMDEAQKQRGSGLGARGVHQIRGSNRNLRDPLESMLQTHTRNVKQGYENMAKQRIAHYIDYSNEAGKFGKFAQKISKPTRVNDREMYEAIANSIRATDPTMSRTAALNAAQEAFPTAEALENFTFWKGGHKPPGDNLMTVMVDGDPRYYQIDDPLMLRSIQAIQRPELFLPTINSVRKFKQSLITHDPSFMAANLVKDSMMSSAMSRTGNFHIFKSMRGLKHALARDEVFQDYIANLGGGAGIYGSGSSKGAAKAFRNRQTTNPSPLRPLDAGKRAWDAWGRIGQAFELGSRLGEYEAGVKQGATAQHAAYMGREVATDFSVHGDNQVLKFYMNAVPFMNAMVAGTDRLYRSVALDPSDKVKTIAKMGTIAAMSAGLQLINRENPQHEDLPDWDKHSAWHFWTPQWENGQMKRIPEGKFKGEPEYDHYKLPKIWEVGALGTIAELGISSLMNDDENADLAAQVRDATLRNFMLNTGSDAFPLPLPVGLDTLVEQYSGQELFTGNPIESQRMSNLENWRRTSARQPRVYGEIGELMRQVPGDKAYESPERLEAFMRQWFGNFAKMGAQMADYTFYPDVPSIGIDQMPVISRFYEKPEKYTRTTNDFFELLTEAEISAATFNHLATDPSAREFLKEHADDPVKMTMMAVKDKMKRAQQMAAEMSKLQNSIREGEGDYTPVQREKEIDDLERRKQEIYFALKEQVEKLKRRAALERRN